MNAMKMINSTTTRGLLANFYRNNLFPAASSAQKLTFSTTTAGNQPENQKKTLGGGNEDPEIRMSPFLKMIDVVKPVVISVKNLMHILQFTLDFREGAFVIKLNTELFPSFKKFLKKSPVRVAVGNEGTTYFIPIPGISVEDDDQLNVFVLDKKLRVFAYRDAAKVGGGLDYIYWVPLPEGYTMDDLTIDHANRQLSVLVPHQKKEELACVQESGSAAGARLQEQVNVL